MRNSPCPYHPTPTSKSYSALAREPYVMPWYACAGGSLAACSDATSSSSVPACATHCNVDGGWGTRCCALLCVCVQRARAPPSWTIHALPCVRAASACTAGDEAVHLSRMLPHAWVVSGEGSTFAFFEGSPRKRRRANRGLHCRPAAAGRGNLTDRGDLGAPAGADLC